MLHAAITVMSLLIPLTYNALTIGESALIKEHYCFVQRFVTYCIKEIFKLFDLMGWGTDIDY